MKKKTFIVECWGTNIDEKKEPYVISSQKVKFKLHKSKDYYTLKKDLNLEIEKGRVLNAVYVTDGETKEIVGRIDQTYPYGGYLVITDFRVGIWAFG